MALRVIFGSIVELVEFVITKSSFRLSSSLNTEMDIEATSEGN